MTYVVTENCIQCRHSDCVDVCPADAFHLGPNFIVINPVECVDCGLCVPECPEDAIVADSKLTEAELPFLELNEKLSKIWPVIYQSIQPMENFERWRGKPNKMEFLRYSHDPETLAESMDSYALDNKDGF